MFQRPNGNSTRSPKYFAAGKTLMTSAAPHPRTATEKNCLLSYLRGQTREADDDHNAANRLFHPYPLSSLRSLGASSRYGRSIFSFVLDVLGSLFIILLQVFAITVAYSCSFCCNSIKNTSDFDTNHRDRAQSPIRLLLSSISSTSRLKPLSALDK